MHTISLIDWNIFPKFLLYAFSATITPGVNNILMFLYTIHYGIRSALTFRAGVLVAFPSMSAITVILLAPVFRHYPFFSSFFIYVGSGLILYLAIKIIISNPNIKATGKKLKKWGFFGAFMLQILNGKAWSMALVAASVYTNPTTHVFTQASTIFMGFFITNIVCCIPWLCAPYVFKNWLMEERNLRLINWIFGSILIYFAVSPFLP